MKYDISIITPVYNEQEFVLEGLEKIVKIFSKEKIKIELIIVDDGSTDRTYSICKEFLINNKKIKIKLIQHNRNNGHSHSVRGMEELYLFQLP